MGTLCIKGICLGEGRPKTIVSLMEAREENLLAAAQRAVAAGAELLEWRADFFAQVHNTQAVVATSHAMANELPDTPLVFTFRSIGEGGSVPFSTEEYEALYAAMLREGAADIVDVELRRGEELARELVGIAHKHGGHAIVSFHDFEKTPETIEMTATLAHMAELGADVAKLAVMAHSPADCARLMEATAQAREAVNVPLVTMAMGASGVFSRLAGEVFGSAATFCCVDRASAPGQVELVRAMQVLDQLHDVLA